MSRNEQGILAAIRRENARLAKTGRMLKGSLNRVVLGKKKVGTGERIAYRLTWKGTGNKTRTLYVSEDKIEAVMRMISNYGKTRKSIEKLVELNVSLFKQNSP